MNLRVTSFAVLLVSLLLACVAMGSATTILSTGVPAGYSFNGYGYQGTATYGQTFVAPSESRLDQFTFVLTSMLNQATPMGAYVGTWTGSSMGTLLFSQPITVSGSGTVDISTGGLNLTPGADYVAFLSVSNYYAPGDYYLVPAAADGGNTGGTLALSPSGGDFSLLYGNDWATYGGRDLQFTATFNSAAPEPSSLLMLGSGVLGLAGVVRRKLSS